MCRVDCAYNYANSAIHAIKPHFRIYHVAKGILSDVVLIYRYAETGDQLNDRRVKSLL